ncbi:hypothetical protein AAHA92_21668 [Salvia divinorum]|uniref:Secreted protein n=1 Tax=Salvia divinorum TaxID=28513 RepID=A0ABD1GPL2_SALDI
MIRIIVFHLLAIQGVCQRPFCNYRSRSVDMNLGIQHHIIQRHRVAFISVLPAEVMFDPVKTRPEKELSTLIKHEASILRAPARNSQPGPSDAPAGRGQRQGHPSQRAAHSEGLIPFFAPTHFAYALWASGDGL